MCDFISDIYNANSENNLIYIQSIAYRDKYPNESSNNKD